MSPSACRPSCACVSCRFVPPTVSSASSSFFFASRLTTSPKATNLVSASAIAIVLDVFECGCEMPTLEWPCRSIPSVVKEL